MNLHNYWHNPYLLAYPITYLHGLGATQAPRRSTARSQHVLFGVCTAVAAAHNCTPALKPSTVGLAVFAFGAVPAIASLLSAWRDVVPATTQSSLLLIYLHVCLWIVMVSGVVPCGLGQRPSKTVNQKIGYQFHQFSWWSLH
jgi:hypothetical protein